MTRPILLLLPFSPKLTETEQINNFSSLYQNPGPRSHGWYRLPYTKSLKIVLSQTMRLILSPLPFHTY